MVLPGQWTRFYPDSVGQGIIWIRIDVTWTRCYLDKTLPGQGLTLHKSNSRESPSHMRPPYAGVGLLHSRVLDLRPRPHVVLQSSHTDHSDHPPSTATTSKYDSVKYFITHFFNVLQRFWCITSVTHFSHATSLYSTSLPISLHFVIAHFNPSEMVHKFNSDS